MNTSNSNGFFLPDFLILYRWYPGSSLLQQCDERNRCMIDEPAGLIALKDIIHVDNEDRGERGKDTLSAKCLTI